MSCPSGKIPYPSPQAAHATLSHLNRRQRGNHRSHKRRRSGGTAYQCPHCAQWHTTSSKPR
jgi:epoxyqueuosine reductase QueG